LRGDTPQIEVDDTQSFQTVDPEAPPPAAPPPQRSGPPPGLIDDVWPWLGLLALLAVAGLLVWLFLFRGNHHESHVVPAVAGLRERVAIGRLQNKGYSVKSIHEPMKRPAGVVGSQVPGAGSQLPTSQTVVIHVSNGKAPPTRPATTTASRTTTKQTTTAAAPTSAVPDVTGQTAAAGAGQVEAAGFVAQTDPVEGAGTPGAITQESPPGGTQAKAGETVTLGVAVGPNRASVQIPDVTGQTAAAARAALLQAKLTVRTTYRQGKTGVVLGQSPTGTAPAWTQVTIAVGR